MAEYIDRNLIKWYGCGIDDDCKECSACSLAECSYDQVMQIPPADVVEREEYDLIKRQLADSWDRIDELDKLNGLMREKIDKSIKEIEDLDPIIERVGLQVKQEILNILKRNIEEY